MEALGPTFSIASGDLVATFVARGNILSPGRF